MFENSGIAVDTGIDNSFATLCDRIEDIKSTLRHDIGDAAFRSWIHPIRAVSYSAGVLEISVPTRFVRDWVKKHYADRIAGLWAQYNRPCNRVDISIHAPDTVTAVVDAATVPDAVPPVANENAVSTELSSPLDPRYTFDSFVTGSTNELAYAACRRVAEGTAVTFNPLYIHGAVGMGKTHLVQATAAAIRAQDNDATPRNCVYMSAEKFMHTFVRAIRAQDTFSFKEKFARVDVLIIDDLQFICGKAQTQQEFLHTFNALTGAGKQVILVADKAPAELTGLDARLQSRLGMGLVAMIQGADYTLRRQILAKKCDVAGRAIDANVLDFLAAKIGSSNREIEGALNRLIAHSELIGNAVTRQSAEDILQDLIRAAERSVTVEDIQKSVAEHYNIRVSDILSPRRARPLARPRQVAMFLAKEMTENSLPEIGRKFGGRDHTTIIHGIRKIESLMTEDAAMRQDVESLRQKLK